MPRHLRRAASLVAVIGCLLAGLALPANADRTAATLSVGSRSVPLGARVVAAGTVPSDGRGRAVRLEYRTPRGWHAFASGSAASSGRYRLRIPTDWLNTFRLRIDAPATRGLARVVTPVRSLHVVPRKRPLGRAADHTFLSQGRWNPCREITWAYNPAGMPATGLAQFTHAFALLHAATGLRFRYVGTTSIVPMLDAQDGPYDPRALITIATARANVVRGLAGAVIGLGGNLVGMVDGVPQAFKGSVVLDRQQLNAFPPGFGAGETQGALMLHELGHVIGLSHSGQRDQMMYPALRPFRAARYGAGDLRGLRQRGAAKGCLPPLPSLSAGRIAMPTVAHGWVDRG